MKKEIIYCWWHQTHLKTSKHLLFTWIMCNGWYKICRSKWTKQRGNCDRCRNLKSSATIKSRKVPGINNISAEWQYTFLTLSISIIFSTFHWWKHSKYNFSTDKVLPDPYWVSFIRSMGKCYIYYIHTLHTDL